MLRRWRGTHHDNLFVVVDDLLGQQQVGVQERLCGVSHGRADQSADFAQPHG
jgi:hypothetical protein